jgi:hypothetical protein
MEKRKGGSRKRGREQKRSFERGLANIYKLLFELTLLSGFRPLPIYYSFCSKNTASRRWVTSKNPGSQRHWREERSKNQPDPGSNENTKYSHSRRIRTARPSHI